MRLRLGALARHVVTAHLPTLVGVAVVAALLAIWIPFYLLSESLLTEHLDDHDRTLNAAASAYAEYAGTLARSGVEPEFEAEGTTASDAFRSGFAEDDIMLFLFKGSVPAGIQKTFLLTATARDPDTGIVAFAGITEEEALDDWNEINFNQEVSLGGLSLLIVVVGLWLMRELARREKLTRSLQESQGRVRELMRNLPGFVFRCTAAGDELKFELAGSMKFDFHRAQAGTEVSPLPFLDFVSPEDREGLTEVIASAQRNRSDWSHAFRVHLPNGRTRWVNAVARLRSDAGVTTWDGVALDETGRIMAKQFKNKLRQAEKMESLGTLAGGVAHEINNLLQPIIMMTELVLSETPDGGPTRDRLQSVVDAGIRASDVVKRILMFGRVDEAAHHPIEIKTLLSEATSFVRRILPSSITLNTEIEENITIVGDPTQLTQVVLNLASNARDAIGDGNGSVTISLSRVELDGHINETNAGTLVRGMYALIKVRDTGSGMDEQTKRRMFEPFFTTKDVGKGTGLGLSVTHGIVTGHGGAMKVESAPGEGTTFWIYLPVEENAFSLGAVPAAGRGTSETITAGSESKRAAATAAA